MSTVIKPKVVCSRCSKIAWSTVSKATDKSRRIRAAVSPRLTACSMSDSTRRTSVSVDCNPYSQLIGCFHKVAGLCNHIVPVMFLQKFDVLVLEFQALVNITVLFMLNRLKIRMHKTLWDMLSFDAVKSGTKSSLGYLPDSYLRVPAAGTTVHR